MLLEKYLSLYVNVTFYLTTLRHEERIINRAAITTQGKRPRNGNHFLL